MTLSGLCHRIFSVKLGLSLIFLALTLPLVMGGIVHGVATYALGTPIYTTNNPPPHDNSLGSLDCANYLVRGGLDLTKPSNDVNVTLPGPAVSGIPTFVTTASMQFCGRAWAQDLGLAPACSTWPLQPCSTPPPPGLPIQGLSVIAEIHSPCATPGSGCMLNPKPLTWVGAWDASPEILIGQSLPSSSCNWNNVTVCVIQATCPFVGGVCDPSSRQHPNFVYNDAITFGVGTDDPAFKLSIGSTQFAIISSPSTSLTVPPATGGGSVTLRTSAGIPRSLSAVPELALSTGVLARKPPGVTFPYGFFSWTITGLSPGQMVSVSLTFPRPLPANSVYWKVDANGNWVNLCLPISTCTISGNTISITMTADATGTISDPGGPGVPAESHPTTTSVSCNFSTIEVGRAICVIAQVSDTSLTPTLPTGTVTFSSTGSGVFNAIQCSLNIQVNPSTNECMVTYTPNMGSEGAHIITGTYNGDQDHAGSSGTFTVIATQRGTMITASCNPDTVTVNHETTCTAVVTDSSPPLNTKSPGGNVAWDTANAIFIPSRGTSSAGSCDLSPSGLNSAGQATSRCSLHVIVLQVGSSTISVLYSGGGDHMLSIGSTTLIVTAAPTSDIVQCSPTSVAVNEATQCTATVTDTSLSATWPTGTVIFSSGSGTFAPGVLGAFASPSSCTLVLSVRSVQSSCSVTYTPSPGSAGTHVVTGSYSGDPTHSGSSNTFSLTVTQRKTSTSVNCNPSTVARFRPTLCVVTVTDTSPGIPITPTGTVSWSNTWAGIFSTVVCSTTSCTTTIFFPSITVTCTIPLTPGLTPSCTIGPATTPYCTLSGALATAKCTVIYVPLTSGAQQLTATYAGDRDHFGSSGGTTITVIGQRD